MDTRIGTVEVARLMTAALLAFCVLLAVAVASPTKADAHQRAGRTEVQVDGELVKKTRDDHLTYERVLPAGCHTVAVYRTSGNNVAGYPEQRECSRGRTVLTVRVDHGDVSIGTSPKSISHDNPMAR